MKDKISKNQIVDVCFKSSGKPIEGNAFITDIMKRTKNSVKTHKMLLCALKDFTPFKGDFVFNHL